MTPILYSTGNKYQLLETYSIMLPVTGIEAFTHFLELRSDGRLTITKGYCWDGPSYPGERDAPNFRRASLVHDSLYELMRGRHLDYRTHRLMADDLMRSLCLEDGMETGEADFAYRMVRKFGEINAMPLDERPVVPVWPEMGSGE